MVMPFRNIFKKIGAKKDSFKKESKEKADFKESKEEKIVSEKEIKAEESEKKSTGFYPFILKSPYITEKSTELMEKNQYIFKVFPRTNKNEIKKAIESTYNVDVLNINIINIPKKKRRLGKQTGWRKGYKKAIIKIKKGQKIDLIQK